jgi:putative membrane protein
MEISRSDQLAKERTDLAGTRTSLAAERTLMAWIRTALGMISFGFTIYKFLHGLEESNAVHFRHQAGGRNLGVFLAALGTGSLIAGTVQYVQTMRAIGGPRRGGLGLVFYISCAVILLGLLVLVGILMRLGPFD